MELQQSFLCYPDAKIPVFRSWEWIPVCPHSSRAELKGPAGIPCGAGGWEGQDHCPLTCRDSSCSSCHTPGTGGRRSLAQKQLGCSKESSTGQSQGSPPLPWRLNRSAQNSHKTERGGSSEAKDQIPGRSQLLPPPEPSGMDTEDSGTGVKRVSHFRGQNHCKVQLLPEILNINKHFICVNTSAKGWS